MGNIIIGGNLVNSVVSGNKIIVGGKTFEAKPGQTIVIKGDVGHGKEQPRKAKRDKGLQAAFKHFCRG